MFDLDRLVRDNVRRLKPYSSARSEFAGVADIFLDANENSFGSPAGNGFNRYPDPLQSDLKRLLAAMHEIGPEQIFIGNGSDEAIDLLMRIFCVPGRDEILICPPTYGMYSVTAGINDVRVREVSLTETFQLDVPAIQSAVSGRTKLIFICSPNNPTGNVMSRRSVINLIENFDGIVVVDEAYIDFTNEPSMIGEITVHPNLVVLQTFSKAWGMAGLRVGMAFANAPIVELMTKIKPPYNVSSIAQAAVAAAMQEESKIGEWINEIKKQRSSLAQALEAYSFVEMAYPSDANFLLVKFADADAVYRHLLASEIVVRDRSNVALCGSCLRITIGTPDENEKLVISLDDFQRQNTITT